MNFYEKKPQLLKRADGSVTTEAIILPKSGSDSLVRVPDARAQFLYLQEFRNELSGNHSELLQANLELHLELKHANEQLSFLKSEADLVAAKRAQQQIAQEKRKHKKRAPRALVSSQDFSLILTLVSGNTFADCRVRLALVLLYVSGLRIGNLRLLTVRHLMELLESNQTVLPLIKRGNNHHVLMLSPFGHKLLVSHRKSLDVLLRNKKLHDPVFSQTHSGTRALSRVKLNVHVNGVLARASALLGKPIRSHSFRISFITILLRTVPIQKVKALVGHKELNSTLLYNRNELSLEERQACLSELDKNREQPINNGVSDHFAHFATQSEQSTGT